MTASPPLNHVFFLLADDWGSYDAGFRIRELGRQPDLRTPAIDALAADGLTFSNYYVQPICSPTRASLLSGRYSIHTGSEHKLFGASEPSCLPTEFPLMPRAFKSLGYQVHGIIRRVAIEDPDHHMSRIQHLTDDLHLHPASMESFPSIYSVVRTVQPDECYHLAAQSFVATSFQDAFTTLNTNINGTHYILAALHDLQPDCRYYFAGSSEMFGKVAEVPQSELTRFHPRSPYGISKVAGYDLSRNYREAYDMHASSGILFNHESPRRGETFVTRKITRGLARIDAGLEKCLFMGNLDALRDWGHARDYVEMQWRMLQQDQPEDFVIATGRQESVRRFIELSASALGWGALQWEGEGLEEVGRRSDTGEVVVRIDPRYFRPAEVETLLGDPTRARERLGWTPNTNLEQMVDEMIDHDREEARKEAYLKRNGFQVVGPRE